MTCRIRLSSRRRSALSRIIRLITTTIILPMCDWSAYHTLEFTFGRMLGAIAPGWEEGIDWTLLLERESFFYLVLSVTAMVFLLLLRVVLAWYADNRLQIPRFHLREHALRAGAAFFSTPEIKQ